MIEINGLTQEQVEMLDFMWSLDTEQEYLEWHDLLDERDQAMADLLMRMIILAEIDNSCLVQDTTQAQEVLKKFALH